MPPTVTTMFPVDVPAGTNAVMAVFDQELIVVAVVPLNVTVLDPCVVPKFEPLIDTAEPAPPDAGVALVMYGVVITVKVTPLLSSPLTVTTTLPVVAPLGTFTEMVPLFQEFTVAVVPMNLTVLDPWLEPQFEP